MKMRSFLFKALFLCGIGWGTAVFAAEPIDRVREFEKQVVQIQGEAIVWSKNAAAAKADNDQLLKSLSDLHARSYAVYSGLNQVKHDIAQATAPMTEVIDTMRQTDTLLIDSVQILVAAIPKAPADGQADVFKDERASLAEQLGWQKEDFSTYYGTEETQSAPATPTAPVASTPAPVLVDPTPIVKNIPDPARVVVVEPDTSQTPVVIVTPAPIQGQTVIVAPDPSPAADYAAYVQMSFDGARSKKELQQVKKDLKDGNKHYFDEKYRNKVVNEAFKQAERRFK